MDQDGNTLLCEASSRAIGVMPSPHKHKLSPISLVVGDTLYLLDSVPGADCAHSVEALKYSADRWFEHKWYWHSLPPPPFGSDYDHEVVEKEEEEEEDMRCPNRYGFQVYTVVGDSQVWISTEGGGTYSFDTANNMWSKAGKWALPFNGPVKYAPEHGLWFGFSSQGENGQFAASDLTAASTARPPVLKKVWDELAQPLPEWWVPMESYLHPLGASKFCIVRTFETPEEGWCWEKDGNMYNNVESFAVFTGVEVERGRRGALRMIKHKIK
ncbi:hypothetical protein U9M48_021643 [Paspalum notatum var. saurae]|uniref:Uncharacterized protein n=1 Tax=Paspalum notatum var. saurae TaxID=547442 RepID=A0AAQ3THU6_PASNO